LGGEDPFYARVGGIQDRAGPRRELFASEIRPEKAKVFKALEGREEYRAVKTGRGDKQARGGEKFKGYEPEE